MFGISSVIGKIFGSDKAITSVISNASSALDKLVYTSEEKAEDQAKAVTEARGMVINWMESTKGQNLARRLIALMVTAVWITQYLVMCSLSVIAVWVDQPAKFHASAKVIGDNAQSMNAAMMLILAFYFSAPYLGDVAKGALKKFSGK